MKNKQGLQGVRRLLITQFIIVLLMARFADLSYGLKGVLSVVLGGLVYGAPNAFFGWMMFKQFKASHLQAYLKRVYRGEALKIVLTLVLFAFAFCFFSIVPWIFLVSFLIVQSTVWMTPWIFVTRECDK